MSYIVAATFETDGDNLPTACAELLTEPWLRLLSRDEENQTVTLDMVGDYDSKQETVRKLANRLIDAGVISFEIRHSY